MTEQELLNNLMQFNYTYSGYELSKGEAKICMQALEEIQQYRSIGTVEEFKVLKEKQIPKKVLEEKDKFNTPHWHCPVCRCELYSGQQYCDECGQNLDSEV